MRDLQMWKEMNWHNEQLLIAYREWWKRMLEAVGKMDENIVEGLSNPFLMKVLPNYIHSPQKILFVGQETKGWEKFQDTLHQIKDREEELAYLQWMYEDFRNRRGGGGSPFWNITRKLFQALVPGHGDDAFMNTNLVKFDFNEGKLPREIEEILCKEFAVLPMEIEILNPDLIIFFTGPDYDERLLSTFNCYRVYQGVILEPVEGFSFKDFAKVSHPALPYHTYRTNHPKPLQLNKRSLYGEIEDFLKNQLR